MRTRTENLLSSRVDDPVDAAARARLAPDTDDDADIAATRAVAQALRSLPEFAPPPGAWDRIAAAAPHACPPRRLLAMSTAALAAGLGAAAVLLTMELAMNEPPLDRAPITAERVADPGIIAAAAPDDAADGRGDGAGDRAGDGPNGGASNDLIDVDSDGAQTSLMLAAERNTSSAVPFAALLEESLRLERMLAEVPYQRPVMTVGTASTIALLEDRISDIDGQLSYGAAEGLNAPQQQALWRDRVDVMNALVQVRFAQARRVVY